MRRTAIVIFLLFIAVGCGQLNPFRGYVERNKYNGKSWHLGDVFPDESARALALAAARGNVKKIRELHEKGVDVNSRGKEGITPLLWAIYAENKEGFEELLKLGANPNVDTEKDSGAMGIMRYAAAERDDSDYLELILKHGGDPNYMIPGIDEPLIHYVCNEGAMKRLELVVSAGADINKRNSREMTAIMYCLVLLQYDKALYLLEKGARYDNSIRDHHNDAFKDYVSEFSPNPKHVEQIEARKKVLEFLAKHGIEVKEKRKESQQKNAPGAPVR